MSKRPAFQFYPSDWRNDAGLRLCSVGARGLWVEMMCLMHDGAPYGHLTVLGRPIGPDALARLVGEGVIFSRRMVRDEAIREARAAGGPAGAEHGKKGASHGAKGGRPRKEKPPFDADERGVSKPAPSSSSPSPASHSDADASGGDPPADPVKVLFDSGIRLLGEAGVEAPQARSLIGKWRRDHPDEAVLAVLGRAQREGAIDPVSFIAAALGARNGKRTHHANDRDIVDPLVRAAAARIAGGDPRRQEPVG